MVPGNATPPAPRHHILHILNRVDRDLGAAWNEGLDITQMVAQEIREEEAEESQLMQRGRAQGGDDPRTRLTTLLSGVHPNVRSQVVRHLRQKLMQQLNQCLFQGIQILALLQTDLLGNETGNTSDPAQVLCSMADFVFERLDFTQGFGDAESSQSLGDMVKHLHETLCKEKADPALVASSSQALPGVELPSLEGTGEDILCVAEDLATALDNMLSGVEANDWLESRREVVLELMQFVQTSAPRTLTPLLLLNRYLPQPNRRDPSDFINSFGKEAM